MYGSEAPGPAVTSALARSRAIWAVTASNVAVGAALFVGVVVSLGGPSHHLPFVPMAALFALSQVAVVNSEVGTGTYTYSPVEVPLVLSLIGLDPKLVVAAWMLGGLVALGVVRRQPPVRLAYNLSCFALEAVAAVVVFHVVSGGAALVTTRHSAGLLAAAFTAAVLSTASVLAAVHLAGEGRSREEPVSYVGFGLTSSAVTASLVITGVVVEQTQPASLWLLGAPVAGAFLVQRAFARHAAARPGRAGSGISVSLTEDRPVEAGSHDALTGLADRRLISEHLARLLSEVGGAGLACLFVCVDDLAEVNDRFGTTTGDQLLVVCAQRLAGCLRDGDLAGRFAANQLVVVAHVSPDDAVREATALGQRIVASLGRPSSLGSATVSAGISVGIVIGPDRASARDRLAGGGQAIAAARASTPDRVGVHRLEGPARLVGSPVSR